MLLKGSILVVRIWCNIKSVVENEKRRGFVHRLSAKLCKPLIHINIPMRDKISETDIDPDIIQQGVAFHDTLNEKLWDEDQLDLAVHTALLNSAYEFTKFLDVPGLKIEDVIFTGSNASYNYTPYSDLDVHVIVDFDTTICPTLAENFFNTKKTLWNQTHDVQIRGYDLEMYVEDTKNPVTANGVYSLLKKQWIREPRPLAPKWDDSAVLAKVEALSDEIEALLGSEPSKPEIDAVFDRLRKMRKAGLAKAGELSTENLAFKTLRNLGMLDRLSTARSTAHDRELSLEGAVNEGFLDALRNPGLDRAHAQKKMHEDPDFAEAVGMALRLYTIEHERVSDFQISLMVDRIEKQTKGLASRYGFKREAVLKAVEMAAKAQPRTDFRDDPMFEELRIVAKRMHDVIAAKGHEEGSRDQGFVDDYRNLRALAKSMQESHPGTDSVMLYRAAMKSVGFA